MDSLKKISQQTFWQLLGKVVTSLSTIFILGLAARKFGTEGTGVYTLALAYIAMFFSLSDFGFNAHLLPHLKGPDSGLIWRKLLGLRVCWSALLSVSAVLILPILPFARSEFIPAAVLGAFAILGNSLFLTSSALFQCKLSFELSTLSSSLGIILMTGLIFWLIITGFGVPSLMAAQSLSWIFTGLLSLILVRKYLKSISPMFDLGFIKTSFLQTWPISLTLVVNLVYFRFDSFVLSSVKSFSDVGIYNLAYSIFQSVLVLPAFIMNGLYPLLIDQLKVGKETFRNYFGKAALTLFLISLLGTLLTYILSPFIINILSGSQNFSGSIESLRILSLGFPIYFLTALCMWTLVSLKKYKTMALIYTIGLLFNMAANLMFIPGYSYIASSWITVLSEALILALQAFVLWRHFNESSD